jgi:hypothetical protein
MPKVFAVLAVGVLGLALGPVADAQDRAATTFVAVLSAENEVPGCPAGEESGAGGRAIVRIDEDTGEITYRVVAQPLPGTIAGSPGAHIHVGGAGEMGPVVQALELTGRERALSPPERRRTPPSPKRSSPTLPTTTSTSTRRCARTARSEASSRSDASTSRRPGRPSVALSPGVLSPNATIREVAPRTALSAPFASWSGGSEPPVQYRSRLPAVLVTGAARQPSGVPHCANLSSDRRATRSAAPLLRFVQPGSEAAVGEGARRLLHSSRSESEPRPRAHAHPPLESQDRGLVRGAVPHD